MSKKYDDYVNELKKETVKAYSFADKTYPMFPEKDKESMWYTYRDQEMFNNKEAFWDSIIDFYDQIVNESGEF